MNGDERDACSEAEAMWGTVVSELSDNFGQSEGRGVRKRARSSPVASALSWTDTRARIR